jgi:hypothetical protein
MDRRGVIMVDVAPVCECPACPCAVRVELNLEICRDCCEGRHCDPETGERRVLGRRFASRRPEVRHPTHGRRPLAQYEVIEARDGKTVSVRVVPSYDVSRAEGGDLQVSPVLKGTSLRLAFRLAKVMAGWKREVG